MKIQLDNVSVIYDPGESNETIGLPPVTLTLKSGKPVVLTGSNGCGKTSLLKVLAGLLTPSSGEVYFEGDRAPVKRDWLRRNATYLRQQPSSGLFADLTLAENLAVSLSESGWFAPYFPNEAFVRAEARLSELVSLYPTHNSRRFSDLSGGQQQLFAVACAGAERRALLLFDEPTSALDTAARVGTEALLVAICRNPELIAVVVTHDVGLASRIGFESQAFDQIISDPCAGGEVHGEQ